MDKKDIKFSRVLACNKLREIRKSLNLTAFQVCADLSIDSSVLSRYENGKVNISLDMLIKLADYYKKDLSILFTDKV